MINQPTPPKARRRNAVAAATPPAATPVSFRQGSKQALLADLIRRNDGASIAELTTATGWQPHTTRAAITGLRKRGCPVATAKRDGVTRYHAIA